MFPDATINPATIALAEAYWREYVSVRPEFRDYRRVYEAVLQRTRNGGVSGDIKDALPDHDERAIRRVMAELRGLLEQVGRHEELLYLLSIEEGRAGRQTDEVRRKRNTFCSIPHSQLPDFHWRKWWSGLFPNTPGARRLPVTILYPTVEAIDNRILTSQGDWQIVKHFSRAFWSRPGLQCTDLDSGMFAESPDEPSGHLIFTGHSKSNLIIDDITFPAELFLRCDGLNRVIHSSSASATLAWPDERQPGHRTVYALVSTFPSLYNESARLWIFEAAHDRALEAVARYFSDPIQLNQLAGVLNVQPENEFPRVLQLVFSIRVNRQNQLVGADGGIQLVHFSHRVEQDPRPESPVSAPRKDPNMETETQSSKVIAMHPGGRRNALR